MLIDQSGGGGGGEDGGLKYFITFRPTAYYDDIYAPPPFYVPAPCLGDCCHAGLCRMFYSREAVAQQEGPCVPHKSALTTITGLRGTGKNRGTNAHRGIPTIRLDGEPGGHSPPFRSLLRRVPVPPSTEVANRTSALVLNPTSQGLSRILSRSRGVMTPSRMRWRITSTN